MRAHCFTCTKKGSSIICIRKQFQGRVFWKETLNVCSCLYRKYVGKDDNDLFFNNNFRLGSGHKILKTLNTYSRNTRSNQPYFCRKFRQNLPLQDIACTSSVPQSVFDLSHNAAYYACLYFIEFLCESVHAFVLVYKASWIQ